MDTSMICSIIPIYQEAPISLELFMSNTSQLFQKLSERQEEKKYLIVDKKDNKVRDLIEVNKELFVNLEIIAVDPKSHFVFGEPIALARAVQGEKPIPTGNNDNIPVFSIEELLDKEDKLVYLEGSKGKKERFSFPKKVRVREIFEAYNSGKEYKGIYFGYPMGTFLSYEQLDDEVELKTDYIRLFDESDCMLDQLENIAKGFAKESCGCCVFGHEGTSQIQMILADIVNRKGKREDVDLLMDLCGVMEKHSLCTIGVAAAIAVNTAIQSFREEIANHITKKSCHAGVCSKFVTYHILIDKCNGCTECLDACQDEAILGKKGYIHVIDQDECTQCGACLGACEAGAIVKAGAIKPKGIKKPLPYKK